MIHGPFHATGEAHWLEADTTTPGLSPTFFGGYAEIGYFLTGETRGYRGGRWDRTSVRNPIGGEQGGARRLPAQPALRLSRPQQRHDRRRHPERAAGFADLDPDRLCPFLINYGHLIYDDAVIPAAGGDRDYSVDVIGARAQVDF